MKKLLSLLLTSMLLYGCSIDESGILDRLDDLEDRVSKLEELCEQMNTNISSLQTIVAALQNNDYITSVTPITENGEEIGYTITFAKSNPITIYHGKDGADGKDGVDGEDGTDGKDGVDGKDGYSPVIGVRQDTDGIYYWTLDGEWLIDENGNKIKAVGTDGKDGEDGVDGSDGITPQLKIEEGYWYISYDNGATWTMLGKATGEDGADGKDGVDGEDGQDGANGTDGVDGKDGDSFFVSVDTSDENYVIFTLVDGTEIKVPTWYAFEELKKLCNQMNTNISSLQAIVEALQNNDYIIAVTPITENGTEIGFTITFAKSNPITIYHGKNGTNGSNGVDGANGKDGHTPVIGVRQDTDGIYYWTLDGEWLLDESGNKIKAVGTDGEDGANGSNGEDGITPQLKIEEGYWFVSYDNGTTWTKLGKATGENGKDGVDGEDGQDGTNGKDGDSMFKEIKQDENNVYFILVDGTEIVVPKQKELSITFSDSDIEILAGKRTTVDYVITGATDKTVVKAFGQGGWYAKVTPTTNSTGSITVTAPDPLMEDEIIVLVHDGEYRSIMTSINFVTGVFSSVISAQEVALEGGNISIDVKTNIQYEVIIPDNAKSWLSVVETKAMRDETVTINCAKNEGLQRTATIKILDEYGKEFSSYAIFQWGVSMEAADMSTNGTANSYIVSNAGYYKFKTTKGNSSELVGMVASAEVLWETFGTDVAPNVGDLISDISYSNDYITFRTGTTYKEGNALIAAKDANGTILWSWHIWLTDQPEDQVYNKNAGTMMDRNLGATSATPGDVGALGLLYQWGRKDPFLGSSSKSSSVQAKSTIETWPSAVESDASNGTIVYATANPITFITCNSGNNDWLYTGTNDTDNTRWQSAKTIYDPCPIGYRVPDGGDNGIWATAFGGYIYPSWDETNKGFDFGGTEADKNYLTTDECWYPAAGYLLYDDGSLSVVGTYGYYWSCTPYENNKSAYLLFFNYFNGDVRPSYNDSRAYGYSVRCLQE